MLSNYEKEIKPLLLFYYGMGIKINGKHSDNIEVIIA
jgi:hypothetical protein